MSNRRAFACLPVVGLVGIVLSGCGTSPDPVAAEDTSTTAAPAAFYVDDDGIEFDLYPNPPAFDGDLSSVDFADPRVKIVAGDDDMHFFRDMNLCILPKQNADSLVLFSQCVYRGGHGVLVLAREGQDIPVMEVTR